MNGKKAKKLKREAATLSGGQSKVVRDGLYKKLKKVHTSLNHESRN